MSERILEENKYFKRVELTIIKTHYNLETIKREVEEYFKEGKVVDYQLEVGEEFVLHGVTESRFGGIEITFYLHFKDPNTDYESKYEPDEDFEPSPDFDKFLKELSDKVGVRASYPYYYLPK